MIKRTRRPKAPQVRWRRSTGTQSDCAGTRALEFLERSRDLVAEPVTAAPRRAEDWVPGNGIGVS